jgi:hypothetical protein
MKRTGTVALVVAKALEDSSCSETLVEALSDDQEIQLFEKIVQSGSADPLQQIYAHREKAKQEDEEFGDYVENLLCQPFLRTEVREHGIQWLKSKMKIEQYQRTESEATRVIANYAYQVYIKDPTRTDFFLASDNAKVRIRVFALDEAQAPMRQSA